MVGTTGERSVVFSTCIPEVDITRVNKMDFAEKLFYFALILSAQLTFHAYYHILNEEIKEARRRRRLVFDVMIF